MVEGRAADAGGEKLRRYADTAAVQVITTATKAPLGQ